MIYVAGAEGVGSEGLPIAAAAGLVADRPRETPPVHPELDGPGPPGRPSPPLLNFLVILNCCPRNTPHRCRG